jgi:hypothetical protein
MLKIEQPSSYLHLSRKGDNYTDNCSTTHTHLEIHQNTIGDEGERAGSLRELGKDFWRL